ncbi:hypothetical protein LDENG_00173070, partial [Lucifuga dentata]
QEGHSLCGFRTVSEIVESNTGVVLRGQSYLPSCLHFTHLTSNSTRTHATCRSFQTTLLFCGGKEAEYREWWTASWSSVGLTACK